ncbi:MAG: PTS sugar transporter subunit IIA [Nitrospinae bacterium]|nr:PTS sugar transporter subunit IIA [Nitrospinota bacterium]
MIGVVIITHGSLGIELLKTAEMIIGKTRNVNVVSIDQNNSVDLARARISNAIKEVDAGDGVLVLTDMFGGTPSNISISFLDELNIEVVSGVNLPMLMKVPSIEEKSDIKEAANLIKEYGRENISVASDLLSRHVEKGN